MRDDSSSEEYVNECVIDALENDLKVLDAKKKERDESLISNIKPTDPYN